MSTLKRTSVQIKINPDWGFIIMVQHLSGMCKALGLIFTMEWGKRGGGERHTSTQTPNKNLNYTTKLRPHMHGYLGE